MTRDPRPGPKSDTLKAWALFYAGQGLEVFPVRAKDSAPGEGDAKQPLVSQYTATTDPAQIEAWWTRWPDALVGHRLPRDHVIIDVDPRYGGAETWKMLRDAIGGWPPTRVHGSGGADGGGHFWFRLPDGMDRLSITGMDRWAQEHGTGSRPENSNRWVCGCDVLRHTHRYTILPPSPHPKTGEPYYWQDGHELEVEPAELPPLLAELLTAPPPPPPPPPRSLSGLSGFTGDSIADWYCEHHQWPEILEPHGWILVHGDGESDGSKWRHPGATHKDSASIKHACLFVYSPNTAFDMTATDDPHGYTKFHAYAVLYHNGQMGDAARHLRMEKDGPFVRVQDIDVFEMVGVAPPSTDEDLFAPQSFHTAASAPLALPAALFLPDVVWDSYEALSHIRQAARSRLMPADATLGSVMARVAANVSYTVMLVTPVGSPVGLTFYAAVVGRPSAGKTGAMRLAAELVPARDGVLDGLPIGSGEGMIDAMCEVVEKHNVQVHHQAIFFIDEGEILTNLNARSGSTLMSTLRSAWTHSTLGQTNASADRKRRLDANSYVYGITLGVQPTKAGDLLSDRSGGTPQRFLWFMAIDPYDGPEPRWPGPLVWSPPGPVTLKAHEALNLSGNLRHVTHHPMGLDQTIKTDLITNRRLAKQGQADDTEAHRDLRRLKTAALLALLDGRMDISGQDWHIADLICTTSSAVRDYVEATVTADARMVEATATRKAVAREMALTETKERRALESAARAVGNVVHRHGDDRKHPGNTGCPKGCLSRARDGKHRDLVRTDEVIQEAVERGWIVTDGDGFRPGKNRPGARG